MTNESIHSYKPFLHCFILQLLSKLCDLSCELCVCPQIYVLNLIWYQSLGRQGTYPPQISRWIVFLSNFLYSYSAPEVEGLPLNTPSKLIVDQDCLINYARYDENLKCSGSQPYFVFCVFAGTTSNGFINSGFISSSSHPIHKLFRMEDEDDCISEETRSL